MQFYAEKITAQEQRKNIELAEKSQADEEEKRKTAAEQAKRVSLLIKGLDNLTVVQST